MMGTSRIARLDSKHEHIRHTLQDMSTSPGQESPINGGRLVLLLSSFCFIVPACGSFIGNKKQKFNHKVVFVSAQK